MLRVWTLLVLSLVLCGCGQESKPVKLDSEESSYTGIVTFDGKPLSTGRIKFIDVKQNPRREYIAVIENGKFECSMRPGKKRVEIRSYKIPKDAAADAGPFPQLIPARYNDDSELSVDLGKPDELTFELEVGEAS